METFLRGLPKAELHVHIEGTLEPELLLELAGRNALDVQFGSVEQLRAAYEFNSLQDFLEIYYQGAAVLRSTVDFYDLTWAYLEKAAADGVRRAEIFFDAQTHTDRGIEIGTVIDGITQARLDAADELGISSGLILCFLRHLSADAAMETLSAALPYRDELLGVGLDSSEIGNPPDKFIDVYARARAEGLHAVAHAGEEGPPEYVWGALDDLGVERIDHGNRGLEDPILVERLRDERVPLTMCPLSNVKLRVVDRMEDHPLPSILEAGLNVSLNSDDPAYFGGYVGDVYVVVQRALGLDRTTMIGLARNSIEASFAPADEKQDLLDELADYVAD